MSSNQTLQKSKRKATQVTFNRNELRILLNEYSRRVAAGEWRDYAMDFTRDRAIFSVFRHTGKLPKQTKMSFSFIYFVARQK